MRIPIILFTVSEIIQKINLPGLELRIQGIFEAM
jgi:hypothetical protein